LPLKTCITNFISLDVSRVTGFHEFPNTHAEVLQQSRQNALQNSYAGERGFASPLSLKASVVGRESTGHAREEDEEAAARENDEAEEEVVRAGLDLAPAAGGKKEAAAAQRRRRVLQPRPPPPATRGKMKEASALLSPRPAHLPLSCSATLLPLPCALHRCARGEIRWWRDPTALCSPPPATCHTRLSEENQVHTYMHARIKFHAYSDK
jgi:hypothetical protein